jgi:peroxiredoxin
MVDLQRLHKDHRDQGLVVLGFNSADRPEIVEDLLEKCAVTYPSILDNSTPAQLVGLDDYRVEAVPTTYVIDRDGKIAAAWIGYQKNSPQQGAVLKKLGIE